MRPPLVFTRRGWLKVRLPRLSSRHPYIGCGPKGGGGCIDCGWPRLHAIHPRQTES
jgi:hypothetical protein